MTALQWLQMACAVVTAVYGTMTAIANAAPKSRLGLFCAKWGGTARHTVEAVEKVEAIVERK